MDQFVLKDKLIDHPLKFIKIPPLIDKNLDKN